MLKLKNNCKKKTSFIFLPFTLFAHITNSVKCSYLMHWSMPYMGLPLLVSHQQGISLNSPAFPEDFRKSDLRLPLSTEGPEMLRKAGKQGPLCPLQDRGHLYMARWPLGELRSVVYLAREGLPKVSSPCQELRNLKEAGSRVVLFRSVAAGVSAQQTGVIKNPIQNLKK